MLSEAQAGRFEIEPDVEDVHSQVELMLTRRLGDTGKKVHTGRSRNDQVLVDLKLFARAGIEKTVRKVESLFKTLQEASEKYKDILIPGYTHLQVAMPSSFGLWFGAYNINIPLSIDSGISIRSVPFGSSRSLWRGVTSQGYQGYHASAPW